MKTHNENMTSLQNENVKQFIEENYDTLFLYAQFYTKWSNADHARDVLHDTIAWVLDGRTRYIKRAKHPLTYFQYILRTRLDHAKRNAGDQFHDNLIRAGDTIYGDTPHEEYVDDHFEIKKAIFEDVIKELPKRQQQYLRWRQQGVSYTKMVELLKDQATKGKRADRTSYAKRRTIIEECSKAIAALQEKAQARLRDVLGDDQEHRQ